MQILVNKTERKYLWTKDFLLLLYFKSKQKFYFMKIRRLDTESVPGSAHFGKIIDFYLLFKTFPLSPILSPLLITYIWISWRLSVAIIVRIFVSFLYFFYNNKKWQLQKVVMITFDTFHPWKNRKIVIENSSLGQKNVTYIHLNHHHLGLI